MVPVRIRHLDSLRAVAASLVVWMHLSQVLSPRTVADPAFLAFLHALPRNYNFGRLGVMIFFAVSGFVICRSFGGPREGGARRFVIKRFWRLYPAFWVSMLGGLWVWWLEARPLSWRVLLANVTMAPGALDQPDLLGVYWTLEIEWLFYGLCLGLYLASALDRGWVLASCCALLAFLPRLSKIVAHAFGVDHYRMAPGQHTLCVGLAVMFWGSVFRLAYDETAGFRRGVVACRGVWLLALLTLAMVDLPDPNVKWALLGRGTAHWPAHLLDMSALLIFSVWVAWWRVDNRVLTFLGASSYSLYLFHMVPMAVLAHVLTVSPVVRSWRFPHSVWLVVCAALSLALAAASYRWVERPAIALGKRWAAGDARRLQAGQSLAHTS